MTSDSAISEAPFPGAPSLRGRESTPSDGGPDAAGGAQGQPHRSPWQQVSALIRPDAPDLAAIAIYAAGVGFLSLALPLAVQTLVNAVAFGTLLQPIVVLSLLLALGLGFAAVLQAVQAWMVEMVQRRLFVRLVSELAERLPRVHRDAFERTHGPELVNRFFDVFLAQKALASLLLGGVEASLAAMAGLTVLAFYHPLLLAFGLFILAGGFLVFRLMGRGAATTSIKESKAKYAVAGWLEEMARHLFALKLNGGGAFARERLDDLATDWLETRRAHYRIVFRQMVGALLLQVVISAALLGLGGWLVLQRELTLGQLVAAELIVSAVVASISKLGGKLESAYDLVASADKLEVLLALPLERAGGESPEVPAGGAALRLSGVRARGGAAAPLDLELSAGAMVALEGNDEQTSAIVEALFGLRTPSTGTILIDGEDLRDVSLAWLRRRVAVVSEAEIFPTTVLENLQASGGARSAREAWAVLDAVGIGERIRSLPGGLGSSLASDGAPLSSDSASLLTLARALAAEPALLVVDGVLDRLPADRRAPLMRKLGEGRTLIVVSKDQSVVAACDSSVRLEEASS